MGQLLHCSIFLTNVQLISNLTPHSSLTLTSLGELQQIPCQVAKKKQARCQQLQDSVATTSNTQSSARMKKKGKGLSFDQKRQRMLAIFHKTKDVYNYQEVEKFSTKAGIPFPSVKEILESLKADSLVECQKIGAGVFYWSFPSRAHQTMSDRLEITQKQIQTFTQQIGVLQVDIQQAKVGRQLTDKREDMVHELEEALEQKKIIESHIEKYIRFDPQRYELLIKQNKELKAAINNEIDNLEQVKKYIKKNQVGVRDEEIQQAYEIPANMEYYQ